MEKACILNELLAMKFACMKTRSTTLIIITAVIYRQGINFICLQRLDHFQFPVAVYGSQVGLIHSGETII